MTAMTVTAAQVSVDRAMGSVCRDFEASEALTIGNVVSLTAAGKAQKADANSATLYKAVGIVVAGSDIAGSTTIPSGGRCTVCVFGPVYGFSSLDENGYGYVSDTAGSLDDAASGTGYSYIVGRVHTSEIFFVNPGIAAGVST